MQQNDNEVIIMTAAQNALLRDYAHLLPEVAQEIAALIGIEKALALVSSLGGTTFPLAGRGGKVDDVRFALLEKAIGMDAAKALAAHYAGSRLYIPNCREALRRVRDIAMITEYSQRIKTGETSTAVIFDFVIRYRLADRVIWDIINKQTIDDLARPAGKPRLAQHSFLG